MREGLVVKLFVATPVPPCDKGCEYRCICKTEYKACDLILRYAGVKCNGMSRTPSRAKFLKLFPGFKDRSTTLKEAVTRFAKPSTGFHGYTQLG